MGGPPVAQPACTGQVYLSLKSPPTGHLRRWQEPQGEDLLFHHLEILLFSTGFFSLSSVALGCQCSVPGLMLTLFGKCHPEDQPP